MERQNICNAIPPVDPYGSHSWKLANLIDDGASCIGVKFKLVLLGLSSNIHKEHHVPKYYVHSRLIINQYPESIESGSNMVHVETVAFVSPHVLDISFGNRLMNESICAHH